MEPEIRSEHVKGGVEFMVKEYERLYTLRTSEISQSEQRVNFFLTISSASVGIIAVLSQLSSLPIEKYYLILQGVLIILLLYGLTTLNRLNARVVQIRVTDQSLSAIREYFARLYPEVAEYVQTYKNLSEMSNYRFRIVSILLSRLRGTLTDLVVLSNSLICGGLVFVNLHNNRGCSSSVVLTWTIISIIAFSIVQYLYHSFMGRKLATLG